VQKQIVALLFSVLLGKIDQLQFFFFHFYSFALEKKGSNSKNSEPETGVAMEIWTSSNNSSC
jgi:hypothetical protein